jgi:hypothetical protein
MRTRLYTLIHAIVLTCLHVGRYVDLVVNLLTWYMRTCVHVQMCRRLHVCGDVDLVRHLRHLHREPLLHLLHLLLVLGARDETDK